MATAEQPELESAAHDATEPTAMIGGVVATCGYLFLAFYAALKRGDFPSFGAVLATAIMGTILAVGVMIVGKSTKGLTRAIVLSCGGLLLFLFPIILAWHMTTLVPTALAILLGGTTGLLAFGLCLLAIVGAALRAREAKPGMQSIRYVLGGAAGVLIILHLVYLLVLLTDEGAGSSYLVKVFQSGQVNWIIFLVASFGLIIAVLVCAVVASLSPRADVVGKSARAGQVLLLLLVLLLVVATVLDLLISVITKSDSLGAALKQEGTFFLVGTIGCLLPFLAATFILIPNLGLVLVAIPGLFAADARPTPAPMMEDPTASTVRAPVERPPAPPLPAHEGKPPASAGVGGQSAEERLARLKNLRAQGLIDEAEFARKKQEIIDSL